MGLAVGGLSPGRMLRSRGKFMASYKTQWHVSNTEGKRDALWSYIVLVDTVTETLAWLWFQFFFLSRSSQLAPTKLAHLFLQSPLCLPMSLTCPLVYGRLWSPRLLSFAKVTLVLQILVQLFLWRHLLSIWLVTFLSDTFSEPCVVSLQASKESHNYLPVA